MVLNPVQPTELPASTRFATRLLHADDDFAESSVAPDISLSTTFRQIPYEGDTPPTLSSLSADDLLNARQHVYSRYTQPVSTRVEKVLGDICNGKAVTYRSGLAAAYAALVHFQPKRIAIREAYHGCHISISVYSRSKTVDIIDIDDDLKEGDLLWIETPINPRGECVNLKHYADKAHAAGAKIIVDSTFAPPPLQDPFEFGVDCIMHSATKYLGGHSDLLAGVLVVKSSDEWLELWNDRTFLGSGLGSLEAYLLLRSLRTENLRVRAQSSTATALALWLRQLSTVPAGQEWDGAVGGVISTVWHSAIQAETESWVAEQMKGGGSPTFAILTNTAASGKELPHVLQFFTAATSLGGVESLAEQRAVSSPNEDPRLVRLSIGLEDLEDLKDDFRRATKQLAAPSN